MGELLRRFTYPRNAFSRTTDASATKALEVLHRVETNTLLRDPSDGSFKDEPFNDMRHLHAIVGGPPAEPFITPIGERFQEMAATSPAAAWRWLLTRSLWLYSVPNGTEAHVNAPARELDIRFNFFDIITRLIVQISSIRAPFHVLYFDELLAVLDTDEHWSLPSEQLYLQVLLKRQELGIAAPGEHAALLGSTNLEGIYGTGRDNMNTIFKKAFPQTGLFSLKMVGNKVVGIYLDAGAYTDPVLGERLRFVLDNPRVYIE